MALTIPAHAALLIDGIETGDRLECQLTLMHARSSVGQREILLSLDRALTFEAEAADDVTVRLFETDCGPNWFFDLLPNHAIRLNKEWIQDEGVCVRIAFQFGAH
jgi:hypothetical protein